MNTYDNVVHFLGFLERLSFGLVPAGRLFEGLDRLNLEGVKDVGIACSVAVSKSCLAFFVRWESSESRFSSTLRFLEFLTSGS